MYTGPDFVRVRAMGALGDKGCDVINRLPQRLRPSGIHATDAANLLLDHARIPFGMQQDRDTTALMKIEALAITVVTLNPERDTVIQEITDQRSSRSVA